MHIQKQKIKHNFFKKGFTLYPRVSFLRSENGFTLIELLVVVAIIGILATVVLASLGQARTRATTAKAVAELRTLSQSFEIYNLDNNDYPGDVAPDTLPAGMGNYLSGGWPEAAYPGAVYDWEYWGEGTANEAVQLSIRFCESGTCNFPNESWASSFTNQSAAYYCILGACRPWESDTAGAVPGYCFNC